MIKNILWEVTVALTSALFMLWYFAMCYAFAQIHTGLLWAFVLFYVFNYNWLLTKAAFLHIVIFEFALGISRPGYKGGDRFKPD